MISAIRFVFSFVFCLISGIMSLHAQYTTEAFYSSYVTDNISTYGVSLPKYETRAVWLTTLNGLDWPSRPATTAEGVQRQKSELCRILDFYQHININTVILQTRIRGSVIYPSAIEPWDAAFSGTPGLHPGYDPLAYCIQECHKRGIELHAWVVCIPLGNVKEQRSYGRDGIMRRHPELCKTVRGKVFMIPGNPYTADYIASICREIAERYDIDGISLDYIRYPESEFRFSDNNLFRGSKSDIAQWRRDNITRIVRRIHDTVKEIKPWVKLSSSPIGKYNNVTRYSAGGWNCYSAVYQDPRLWLREHLQDMLFPMMYFQGNHFYPFLYDWQENSYGHPVVPGLGIYFLDPKEGRWNLNQVRAEMYTVRNSGTGGIAFYRSRFLTDNVKGLYDCCANEFFPYPALTTRMQWMSQFDSLPPAPQYLRITPGVLEWQGSAPYYNIYGSNEYPVDCNSANNIIATRVEGNTYSLLGRVEIPRFFAVTACNRYGNETSPLQQPEVDTISARVLPVRASYLINRDLKGVKKHKKKKRRK